MAIRKHWKKILLGLVIAAVFGVTIGLPYAFARLVTRAGTRPLDLRLTSSPSDYDLDFENVSFTSADGVTLSGWHLGGASSDVAIACGHGLFRSRREVLDRAAFFRKQGYDTLVFDFRRHGESEGERVTLGFDERLDFLGAVTFLKEKKPGVKIVLYGVSMGAAAALLAASETQDVAAVIADSSFLSLEHTVVHHLDLIFGLPRFPLGTALLFFLEMQGDFDRSELDLERTVAAIGDRPMLIVAGEDDQRMPVEIQRRLHERAINEHSRFRSFPGASHGAAYRTEPEGYEAMLTEFLSAAGLPPSTNPEPGEASGGDSSPSSP